MGSPERSEGRDLSLAVRVEEVCNRFEAAWRAGVPHIEDFLDGWQGDERRALLRELILLDSDYRRALSEEVTREQYVCRFAELPPEGLTPTANTQATPAEAPTGVGRPLRGASSKRSGRSRSVRSRNAWSQL